MSKVKTQIVGIMNLTPDSFSDGGALESLDAQEGRARVLMQEGAHVLDIGAESTRPGAEPLSAAEEWERLRSFCETVVPKIREEIIISIDTRHPDTAKKALDCGVHWINDVNGLRLPEMRRTLAAYACQCVFMHSLSVPADKSVLMTEQGELLVEALIDFASQQIEQCVADGIAKERLIFDPGIGFGKDANQSLFLLSRAEAFSRLGIPLLIGHSRKSYLSRFTDSRAADRDEATLYCSAALALKGVDYLRVHDVRRHVELLSVLRKLCP